MLKNILKGQKTRSGLGDLYVNDWKKKGIGTGILQLVFRNFQGLDIDKSPIRLKKRS